jgi:hypothetical protein
MHHPYSFLSAFYSFHIFTNRDTSPVITGSIHERRYSGIVMIIFQDEDGAM